MDDFNLSNDGIRKNIRKRFRWICYVFVLLMFVVFYHVFKIQFLEGAEWRAQINKQTRENVILRPVRGNIYSRDYQLMTSTMPYYRLYMDMQCVKKDTLFKYIGALSNRLSGEFRDRTPNQYVSYLERGYNSRSREFLITSKKVPYLELRKIKKFPLFSKGRFRSGLYTREYHVREKFFGSLASRTVGDIYNDFAKGGKSGLELQYDSLLRGKTGECIRKKVAGKFIDVPVKEPENGIDIVTTLNIKYQDIAETALRRELTYLDASSGTAILMDVKTGQVLAISNLGGRAANGYYETENYAVKDMSAPGSTFKTFSMIVALEDGYVHPNDTVDTGNGIVRMYGRRMKDHNANRGGYHVITAAKSIWYSSNVGVSHFIDEYYRKNPEDFVSKIKRLGFGKLQRVDIPGATLPYIKDPESKSTYWSKTDLPWMSIGYVTQIPPIYTLAMYNAIANNGKLMQPYFVREFLKDGERVKEVEPKVLESSICSGKTLKEIRLMLDSVVQKGTGMFVKSDFVDISGKSGTAQILHKAGLMGHQVAFAGYFPSYKPKYSCIVVIRYPRKGAPSGGHQAGAVFKEIAERIYAQNYKIDLDDSAKIAGDYPAVYAGNTKYTESVFDELSLPFNPDSLYSKWSYISSDSTGMNFTGRHYIENLVPNVRGMGARDAVYILGSAGLNVEISGRGRVVSQSLRPGIRYNKGQYIYLRLK